MLFLLNDSQLTSENAAIVTRKGMIQPFPAYIVIDSFLIGIIAIHLIAGRPIGAIECKCLDIIVGLGIL